MRQRELSCVETEVSVLTCCAGKRGRTSVSQDQKRRVRRREGGSGGGLGRLKSPEMLHLIVLLFPLGCFLYHFITKKGDTINYSHRPDLHIRQMTPLCTGGKHSRNVHYRFLIKILPSRTRRLFFTYYRSSPL